MRLFLVFILIIVSNLSYGQQRFPHGNPTSIDSFKGTLVARYSMLQLDTAKSTVWSSNGGAANLSGALWLYNGTKWVSASVGVTQTALDDTAAAIRADFPSGGSTDSFVYSTKAYRQKGVDSLNTTVALRVKYTDTAAMLLPYQRTVNATNGTVTSVGMGYGVSGGTITTSGTIVVDTAAMATRSRVQKAVDSLNISIGTKGSGTVTNVATNSGTGITGGAITGTGTIAADTFLLGTRSWRNKGLDSVAGLIPSVTGYVPYTGATSNVDLGSQILTTKSVKLDTLEPKTNNGFHIHNHQHDDIMQVGVGGGQTLSIYGTTYLDNVKIQNSTDTVLTTNSSGLIGKAALASVYLKTATAAATYQPIGTYVTSVATGTNIAVSGTTVPTVSVTGTIGLANGGTNATTTTSVNGTPITYGANNTLAVGSGTVTNVIGGTNISITGTSTIQPTVNITGTIATANGGTGTTVTTSVNTTPITYGTNNTVTASANTLTTTTLNPTVVTSSLTSVGTVTSGTWSSTISGTATGSTQAINTNNTTIATTAYVDRYFPVDTTISAAYTLTSRDFYRTIHCTNSSNIALTIPTGLGTTFTCVVLAEGTGTVTPTASSTTLKYQPTSTTKIKTDGGATIRSYATANTYLIIGSLE